MLQRKNRVTPRGSEEDYFFFLAFSFGGGPAGLMAMSSTVPPSAVIFFSASFMILLGITGLIYPACRIHAYFKNDSFEKFPEV